jgi:pimeloyl-ACP methyl ester carboxylesterase
MTPDEMGVHDGLAYAVFRPATEPIGTTLILHGADSSKEHHFDFGRMIRGAGMTAVLFDARGHGASPGALDGRMVDDVASVARALGGPGPLALRGSSMGGWLALAAAGEVDAEAVVAICPASGEGLRRGVREGRFAFPADVDALDALFEDCDADAAAAALGERLLLMHAEGDDRVPVERSQELHASSPGSRLVAVPGGHHGSVQHDPDLQAYAARFIARRLAAAGGGPPR